MSDDNGGGGWAEWGREKACSRGMALSASVMFHQIGLPITVIFTDNNETESPTRSKVSDELKHSDFPWPHTDAVGSRANQQ